MAAEIGFFACVLAFLLSITLTIAPMWGAQKRNYYWMSYAVPLSYLIFICVSVAFAALVYSFVINDVSMKYVISTSNSTLPIYYRITALWGAHEGALLLWIMILAVWTALVAALSRSLPLSIRARVLAIIGAVTTGFLGFLIFTSNPFERTFPYLPIDGNDLNPLLQDFGFLIHPPVLYMGYVGFVVAFAFSVAALIEGRFDTAIAKWTRPWTIAAWLFLTLGISLGSWWAYYELGWGGWWMWDPVENASFMPWLTGTALIHSLIITEKRGTFKGWTLFLAITTFSLTLLGTFLVRSGVLTSVHAFASDPVRGIYILIFLGIIVGGALVLFSLRGHVVASDIRSKLVSREGFMLLNNILLAVAAATVLLGTLYPLIYDALGLGKVSVGAPYFNLMFALLMSPLLIIVAVGPLLRWKSDSFVRLIKELRMPLLIILSIMLLSFIAVALMTSLSAGFAVAVFILFLGSACIDLAKKSRYRLSQLSSIKVSVWAMYLAHLGLLVTAVGAIMSSVLSIQKDVRFGVGQTMNIAGYQFVFKQQRQYAGPNFTATQAVIEVSQGDWSSVLKPEKRRYPVRNQVMTEAAIDPSLMRDLYVSLGEPLDNGDWAMRVYVKPFVRWIWLGTIFMALAGLLAILGSGAISVNGRSREVGREHHE